MNDTGKQPEGRLPRLCGFVATCEALRMSVEPR